MTLLNLGVGRTLAGYMICVLGCVTSKQNLPHQPRQTEVMHAICQIGAAISPLIFLSNISQKLVMAHLEATNAAPIPALAYSRVLVCRGLLGDSSSEEEEEDAAELAAESDQVRQSWLTCMIHLIHCLKAWRTFTKIMFPTDVRHDNHALRTHCAALVLHL